MTTEVPFYRCHLCSRPATCLGHTGDNDLRFRCDGCCSHNARPGHCRQIEQADAARSQTLEDIVNDAKEKS